MGNVMNKHKANIKSTENVQYSNQNEIAKLQKRLSTIKEDTINDIIQMITSDAYQEEFMKIATNHANANHTWFISDEEETLQYFEAINESVTMIVEKLS